MSTKPQELNQKDLIGKLCILDFEMPVTEDLLNSLGKEGSNGLDELFEFSVSYSTTLLSSIPAFYQKEVEFPVVVDQVLGTLYKHPKQWQDLIRMIKADPELVTIYVCPISGVPKIISSDQMFKITVNDLVINMKPTGLSRLSRITHHNLSKAQGAEALEYINETGFLSAMIEDMNQYVGNLFAVLASKDDDVFMDFIQDLVFGKEVAITLDSETGAVEVLKTENSVSGQWSDSGEETLQDLLGDDSEEEFDKIMESVEAEENNSVAQSDEGSEIIFDEFKVSKEDMKSDTVFFRKGNNTIN